MEQNPYEAPNASLDPNQGGTRSLGWKVYFVFITALSVWGYLYQLADPHSGLAEYFSIVLWLTVTVGLFGHAFVKPIMTPPFWLIALVANIAFSIAYYWISNLDLRAGMTDTEYYVTNVIAWCISLPAYFALYFYSRPDDIAWRSVR
ncbi:MAG: hypothetical protein AAF465_09210 [Pseudomonadota bacterium]